MNFTLGTRNIDLSNVVYAVGDRSCSYIVAQKNADYLLKNIDIRRTNGEQNSFDVILSNLGISQYDMLSSIRSYLQVSSIPLTDREATARSFASFANQMYQVAQDKQVYVTNMDKKGGLCIVNCYGRPDCRYSRNEYDKARTRTIDAARSWLDLREEFNSVADVLSAQGDSLISDQEALSRLNRIQADSKQAQAEADQKALIADITRIGIAVVSVVAVFFLYKYISKFVK